MSKMAGKLGEQNKQPGDSKAEASAGRSTAARGEAIAFTLAAGSIGLAISLLEQERAEAATNLGHDNATDHSGADGVAVSEASSSGGDNLASINAGDSEGSHGAGSASISAAAEDGSTGDPAVNLESAQAPAAPAQEEGATAAPETSQHSDVAMSSGNPTHESSAHVTAGVTVNVPHNTEATAPSTPHQTDTAENINHNLPSVTDGTTLPGHPGGAESPVDNVVDAVIPGIIAPVEGVVGHVGGVVDNVLGSVGEVVSGVGGVVDNVLGTVGGLVGGLLGGDGKGVLADVGHTVENVVGTVGDTLSGVVDLVGGLLGGGGKDPLSDVGSTVDHALGSVGETVSGLGDAVGDLLGSGGKGVLSEVGSTVDDVLGTVGSAVSGIGGLVGGVLGGITSAAADGHTASAPNMLDAANEILHFSEGLFGFLTPTLSFLGQATFVPNDPVDIANHHGTTLHGQTWEG